MSHVRIKKLQLKNFKKVRFGSFLTHTRQLFFSNFVLTVILKVL